MNHKVLHILFLLLQLNSLWAQQPLRIDSMRKLIDATKNDTLKLVAFTELAVTYSETNLDSSFFYAEQQRLMAQKLRLKCNEADALAWKGYALLNMGNFPRSLQTFLTGIAIAEDPKAERRVLPQQYLQPDEYAKHPITPAMIRLSVLAKLHHFLGVLYDNVNNYEKAVQHHTEARQLIEQGGLISEWCTIYLTLGRVYLSANRLDSALYCEQKAYDIARQTGYKRYNGSILLNLGRIYAAMKKSSLAAQYFRQALKASFEEDYLRGVVAANLALADLYDQPDQRDSGLYYVNDALREANNLNAPGLLLRCYTALAGIYRTMGNKDSTLKYQELIIKMKDSVFNSRQVQQFQNIDFDEQQRKQEMDAAREVFRYKLRIYGLLTGLGIFLLVALFLWRNNRQRKKVNVVLHRQNKELQTALRELEVTQKQLIQQEKMASLGELTAGIAHEIQNPLNFVNNFSEVSVEMLDEMEEKVHKGNKDDLLSLVENLKQNLEKITRHGRRADAIVKSMLQHSRTGRGEKENIDVNALVDEYLRLSYHAFRAREKTFDVAVQTSFDKGITLRAAPQEIGLVLLNLFNNAFYAVNEKKKNLNATFEPAVSVSTKKEDNKIVIAVRDNGTGIPEKSKEKIFQPFFTTKPTGEGTGLGLSLSYDIIKAHGGQLKVEANEGEGAAFVIQLPCSDN